MYNEGYDYSWEIVEDYTFLESLEQYDANWQNQQDQNINDK